MNGVSEPNFAELIEQARREVMRKNRKHLLHLLVAAEQAPPAQADVLGLLASMLCGVENPEKLAALVGIMLIELVDAAKYEHDLEKLKREVGL